MVWTKKRLLDSYTKWTCYLNLKIEECGLFCFARKSLVGSFTWVWYMTLLLLILWPNLKLKIYIPFTSCL